MTEIHQLPGLSEAIQRVEELSAGILALEGEIRAKQEELVTRRRELAEAFGPLDAFKTRVLGELPDTRPARLRVTPQRRKPQRNPLNDKMRAWARANGYVVKEFGALPVEVQNAYRQANE